MTLHRTNDTQDLAAAVNDGTQAIRRAAAILQKIAASVGDGGLTLSDAAASLALSRSTTHRMLKCLVEVGMATYDPRRRRYEIGPLTYELGLAVPPDLDELARWRGPADRIARRTGATTYLMRRSGIEAVCLYKAEGTSLIRVIPVEVGQRRLLGVGAGATALLAALDPSTIKRVVAIVSPDLGRYANLTPEILQAAIAAAQATGIAISRGGVFSAVLGMGIAVPRRQGPPVLALSLAAHASDADDRRIEKWREVLAGELAAALSAFGGGHRVASSTTPAKSVGAAEHRGPA